MHRAFRKLQHGLTRKGLERCCRPFLKVLPQFVGYEEVMYIALVGEKIAIMRANRSVLVILDLAKSMSATCLTLELDDDLRVAER